MQTPSFLRSLVSHTCLSWASFVILVGTVTTIGLFAGRNFLPNPQARDDLLRVFHAVRLGTTEEELRTLLNEQTYPHLTIIPALKSISGDVWKVATPIEFGAKNWIVYVQLQDQKVSAICVRTADSTHIRPTEAPEDVIAEPTTLGHMFSAPKKQ